MTKPFNRLPRKKYQRLLASLSLGELQLLLHGLHIIGDQDRVDLRLLSEYRVLSGQIAIALEHQAARAGVLASLPQEKN